MIFSVKVGFTISADVGSSARVLFEFLISPWGATEASRDRGWLDASLGGAGVVFWVAVLIQTGLADPAAAVTTPRTRPGVLERSRLCFLCCFLLPGYSGESELQACCVFCFVFSLSRASANVVGRLRSS